MTPPGQDLAQLLFFTRSLSEAILPTKMCSIVKLPRCKDVTHKSRSLRNFSRNFQYASGVGPHASASGSPITTWTNSSALVDIYFCAMLPNFAMASLTSCTGVLMDVGVLLFRSTRLVLRPTRPWTVVWQMSPSLHHRSNAKCTRMLPQP